MKDNDIKTQLKKSLTVIFEISYDELYKEYSSANPLSDEIDFINFLIKNQKQRIDVIQSEIDFFFDGEITTKEEYENIIKRDEFWFYKEYSTYLKNKLSKLNKLPPINSETDTGKYTAKHYLLAYLFECNAKGESYPIGNKKELERIGNERMGAGKGNRFYKVFNEVINKDLNAEKNLFEIGGEYWRKAVIELSKAPELVENYLQSKQL